MFSREEFYLSAVFGAMVGGILTILFLKLWQDKKTATKRETRGLSGFNKQPDRQAEENDERPGKTPQEHEERF